MPSDIGVAVILAVALDVLMLVSNAAPRTRKRLAGNAAEGQPETA